MVNSLEKNNEKSNTIHNTSKNQMPRNSPNEESESPLQQNLYYSENGNWRECQKMEIYLLFLVRQNQYI